MSCCIKKQNNLTQFTESGLIFRFSRNAVVQKYDEHRYFRRLSGSGLKGVDFLSIFDRSELVLIEVKNYRIRYKEKPPTEIYHILQHPEILAEKILAKAADTLQMIRVVNKFYRKSRWHNLILPALEMLRNSRFTRDTRLFWVRAENLTQAGNFKFVLWLETETAYPNFSEADVNRFRRQVERLLANNVLNINFTVVNARTAQTVFGDKLRGEILSV